MSGDSLGYLSFAASTLLLVWAALAIAYYAAVSRGERFWVAVAAVALNIGVVGVSTSLLSQMRPPVWLLAQCLTFAATAGILRSRHGASFSMSAPVRAATSGLVTSCRAAIRTVPRQRAGVLVLGLIVMVFVTLSGLQQYLTPVIGGDEKMYHASRVLYWIQHQEVFPYVTHNDRQNVFSFGSELIFLFPVLFTRSELIGRMVFWLGYPTALVGMYLLLRELGAKRSMSLAGILLFVSTPLVMRYSVGLKAEIWLTVFVLGTGFWTLRARAKKGRIARELFLAALFSVLSINVKFTAMVLLPVVAVLPWLVGEGSDLGKNIRAILLGGLAGFALSGLAVVVGSNLVAYGRALGPEAMQQVHRSALSLRQLYTHSVRLPFLLLELPDVPSALMREHISRLGNSVIHLVGADIPLPLEEPGGWPGTYVYSLPEYGDKFSIGGLLWLPALAVGAYGLARDMRAARSGRRASPISPLVAMDIALLGGSVYLIRWMVHSGIPERFLVASYSLGVTIMTVLLQERLQVRGWVWSLAIVVMAYALYSPLRQQVLHTETLRSSPIPISWLDAPFEDALERIEPGSHILLVGSQGVADYPLLGPREGYANQVTSWGKQPFDVERMQSLLDCGGITHILIENDQAVWHQWTPPVTTSQMVAWLAASPQITEIKLPVAGMRLFQTDEASMEQAVAPIRTPLVQISPELRGQIGISSELRTPWPVEDFGPEERGFLWLGHGPDEGLEGALWSRDQREAVLRFDVLPGPSREDTLRTIELSVWGEGWFWAARRSFDEATSIEFTVPLRPGRNQFRLDALDVATILEQPNGDTRNLIVGLHEVVVEPSP